MNAYKASDNETLVRMWVQGRPVDEIAEAIGTNPYNVKVKATRLRQMGVNLPKRQAKIDVEKLNHIIMEETTYGSN